MAVTAEDVKRLREETGAGVMDAKRALDEAGGNFAQAKEILREKGVAAAAKRSERETSQGIVEAYIHGQGRIGALVDLRCETDFVARTDQFQELVKDISMQIAAADPRYLNRDEVPAEILDKEKEIARDRARAEGKPEKILDKIVEGRLAKFYEEVCLLDQPFIKDNTQTIDQLIKSKIASLQENITIARFSRFKVGETAPVEAAEAAE